MMMFVHREGFGCVDPYNKKHTRNVNNTNRWYYNCAGYALGLFGWYHPYPANDDTFDNWRWGDGVSDIGMTMFCVGYMLSDIKGLRLIRTLDELKANEYAIAFRLSSDGDFHYIRRADNGRWYHKMGASSTIRSMSKAEVFSDRWCDRYDLPMVLFAKEKNT